MPAMASKTITTKRGDTLHGLARKYGVWPIDIAKANNLPAGSNIKDGVRLTIPDPPATVWIRPTLDRLSVVNSDRIMVRLGPGSQYRRTTLLDSGSVVRVTAKAHDGAPHEKWLVLDGSLGANSIEQARIFHEAVGLTGLIVTKLDGTARGGALVAVVRELGVPVRFIGVGEQPADLQPFDARAYARSIVGLAE